MLKFKSAKKQFYSSVQTRIPSQNPHHPTIFSFTQTQKHTAFSRVATH